MAGKGRPGPAPGSGGRPRLTTHKPNNGYTRSTTGPKGNGVLRYDQDIKMGVSNLGHKGLVVDHRNGQRAQDNKANLRVVSRSVNRTNQHPGLAPKSKAKKKG